MNWKEGREGRKKAGRKAGRKGGKEEGRQEGRKEGRKEGKAGGGRIKTRVSYGRLFPKMAATKPPILQAFHDETCCSSQQADSVSSLLNLGWSVSCFDLWSAAAVTLHGLGA